MEKAIISTLDYCVRLEDSTGRALMVAHFASRTDARVAYSYYESICREGLALTLTDTEEDALIASTITKGTRNN